MRRTTAVGAMALAAGLACSGAAAQTGAGSPLAYGGVVRPAYIVVNGERHPVASPATDEIQVLYDNGITPTAPAGSVFGTGQTPRWHLMDEVSLSPGPGAGAGRTLTAMEINIASVAASQDQVAVRIRIWDTVNAAAPNPTPVTSDMRMDGTLVFNAPAGGWAAATYYETGPIDLTVLPPTTTTDDAFAVDLAYLTVVGGNPTTTGHTNFTVAMAANTGSIVNPGSSTAQFWNDLSADGNFTSNEVFNFTPPAVGNFVMQISGDAPPAATGGCCFADGSCQVLSAGACAQQNGSYRGNNTDCATQCNQPGACCLVDGSCTFIAQPFCTNSGSASVFGGVGTPCGSVTCTQPPGVIFTNCNLATGTTTLSGVPNTPGDQWSECAVDSANPSLANTTAGFGGTGANRLADNFVVPAGGRHIQYVKFPVYTTGATFVTTTGITLQILNGPPNAGGTPVFGDTTTNRMAGAVFSNIYRIFNTVVPGQCGGAPAAPGQTRRVQWVYALVNQTLPAGTYWLNWNYTGGAFSPPATAQFAQGRQCDPSNSNALQFNGAAWAALTDTGQPVGAPCPTPPVLAQDMYFEVLGGPPQATCYANCDGSTQPPVLNVQDFSCFLTRYAAGDSYANCDGSTQPPVLNVQDFSCFLIKYAAGC